MTKKDVRSEIIFKLSLVTRLHHEAKINEMRQVMKKYELTEKMITKTIEDISNDPEFELSWKNHDHMIGK